MKVSRNRCIVDHVRTGGDGAHSLLSMAASAINLTAGVLCTGTTSLRSMALAKMREIAAEVHTKFQIDRVSHGAPPRASGNRRNQRVHCGQRAASSGRF